MLFSRDDVADYVTRNFEPVWESVRPVPVVRIDFGNGTVLTRTLHGNIATYACSADGEVLDILPGIYEPKTYLDRLNQFRLLANYVDQEGKDKRETRLRDYHKGQIEALKKNEMPPRFVNMADFSKLKIENQIKALLMSGEAGTKMPTVSADVNKKTDTKLDSAEDLASWELLARDTEQNERVRRLQVHEKLTKDGAIRPEKVTKYLYKEILHADLDDPYLGLGKVLFADYPFANEERPK